MLCYYYNIEIHSTLSAEPQIIVSNNCLIVIIFSVVNLKFSPPSRRKNHTYAVLTCAAAVSAVIFAPVTAVVFRFTEDVAIFILQVAV